MKNKKLRSILGIVLAAAFLSACSETAPVETAAAETAAAETTAEVTATEAASEESTVIRAAGLTGPTTMGLVKLMSDAEEGKAEGSYEFSLYGSADEVTPKLVKGELDVAAVPANLASVLYNNTNGEIKLLAVNTLGVLYIVETGDTVTSIEDLKGRTVYATGKGSTPEYTLRYLLSEHGINPDSDLTIEFKSEPAEIVALMTAGEDIIAMLPQPYVTVAGTKVEGLSVKLDLTKEWQKLGNDSELITGVMVGRKEFIEAHPEAVENFLSEYEASVTWVKENNEEASQLIEKYGIVKAAVAQKALPACNLTFMKGSDMKAPVAGYLGTLFAENPKAVGGALPGDDFYYE